MFGVKKLLAVLLLSVGLGSCGEGSYQNYHGVKYRSYSDVVTLPLVAFEDNTTRESSGCFVVCIGSYNIKESSKYRVLVEFPDKTLKVIEFKTSDLFIKYGEKCTITASMHGLKKDYWWDEVILEVPEGSVRYENVLDGK